jgi:hypothetical protein
MRITLALALLVATQDQTVPEEIIFPVQTLSGTLSAWRAGPNTTEKLEKSARVSSRDRLGTPSGETARFATDGPLVVLVKGVKVAPQKGLSLARKDGKMILQFHNGTLVVESYESDIELLTPHGKVSGKEVHFIVTADESSTRVVSLAGSPTFSTDLGEVTIVEGQSSQAEKGKAPSKPKAAGRAESEVARSLEADANLIPNPGFEDGLTGWKTDYPTLIEDVKVVHGGRRSCRCPIKLDGQSGPVIQPRTLKGVLKPGAWYLVRFYVRTEAFQCNGKPGVLKFAIDPGGRSLDSETTIHYPFEGSEGVWSVRRYSFEAKSSDFILAMHTSTEAGVYTGTVWFDDFFLAEFPALRSAKK